MRTLIRTPIKSLLILLFLCGTSLLFISQWSSWYLDRESREAAKESYAAVGQSDNALVHNVLDDIMNSEYVSAINRWYEAPVYLEAPGMHCVNTTVRSKLFKIAAFEGTLVEYSMEPGVFGKSPDKYLLTFRVDQMLAGVSLPFKGNDTITVYTDSVFTLTEYGSLDDIVIENPYFVKASPVTNPGQISQYDLQLMNSANDFLYPLADAPADYLEREPLTSGVCDIRGEQNKTDYVSYSMGDGTTILFHDQFLRTMDGLFVEDLTAEIRFMNGSTVLIDGRLITAEDVDASVCMVSEAFADLWGLKVGDSFPVSVGVKTNRYFAESGSSDRPDYTAVGYWPMGIKSDTMIVEIVGIFSPKRNDGSAAQPTDNSVYLSAGCWPTEFFKQQQGWSGFFTDEASEINLQLRNEYFSFRLRTADDTVPFMDEMNALGIPVTVDDMGYSLVRELLEGTGVGIMGAAASLLVLIAGLILAAYLFLLRRRKDYAILRSLGVPAGTAARSIAAPFLLLGCTASVLAGVSAKKLGTRLLSGPILDIVKEDPSILPGATAAYAELPAWLPVAGAGIAFLLLSLVTLIALIRLRTTATLSLLQEKED